MNDSYSDTKWMSFFSYTDLKNKNDFEVYDGKMFSEFFHTNNGFNIAHKKGYEIWLDCKSYYHLWNYFFKFDTKKQLITFNN